MSAGDDLVEPAATLVPSNAEPAELDAVIAALERSPQIRSPTWTVETVA